MSDYLRDRLVVAVGAQYLVEEELGRGGTAVVYRALDLRLQRQVAIKVLPPDVAFRSDVRERFLREAQTAAQLSHPNIVAIFSVGDTDALAFIVMAYVEGESLAALLARRPRLEPDEVLRTLEEVSEALAYAHAHGVVHRDVKPDNILLERSTGRALVTDFGIARAAAESRLTVTGVAVGTPANMSPEQALGEFDVDGRSDIYSLGIVAYQMLAGETPFRAINTPAMLMKHLSEPPRPLRERRPDTPLALAGAIERALAKRREDRWQDAMAFHDALVGAAPSAPQEVPAVPWPRPHAFPPVPATPSPPPPVERWLREVPRPAQAARPPSDASYDDRPLLERIATYRRHLIRTVVGVPVLFAINAWSGGVPWFVFPSAFLVLDVFVKAGSLWADGIGPIDALKKGIRAREAGVRAAATSASPAEAGSELAPSDVLASPYGDVVRRAAADRTTMREVLAKLGAIEREMLPDVMPTVDALAERVGSLALMLHRLDADVSGTSLAQVDKRLADTTKETATAERDRRLALLQRQRSSVHDLLERRRALAGQLESASLALQNLKLDSFKLRSAGVTSALAEVTSATQEARALSRDIGHLLAAADDVRRL